MVPTVDLVLRTALRCSTAMWRGMFSTRSTRGLSMRSRNWPGVGGEGLDVAALALGKEGVEGEGALAGAASKPVTTIGFPRGRSKVEIL